MNNQVHLVVRLLMVAKELEKKQSAIGSLLKGDFELLNSDIEQIEQLLASFLEIDYQDAAIYEKVQISLFEFYNDKITLHDMVRVLYGVKQDPVEIPDKWIDQALISS